MNVRSLLLRASLRFYRHHPWQLVLALIGVALGVAVYVGVTLANDSARRAFELSSTTVLGRATHRLLPVGGEIPESLYTYIVTEVGVTAAAPVIEAQLRWPGRRDTLLLLGVDPFKEPNVRGLVSLAPGESGAALELLTSAGSVLLPEREFERPDLQRGERVSAIIDNRRVTIVPVGTVLSAADPPAVADISVVQALTGRAGTIDRIDLALTGMEARDLVARLPPGVALVEAGGDRGFDQLSRAFRTNLTALGLLALVVGMFLIYSTMSFAILQRRTDHATLLALGLPRPRLLESVLMEALVLGCAATAVGLALGTLLAQGLVGLVLNTLGDLWFAREVRAADPSLWVYAAGGALGIGATLVAALGPAIDATRTAPAAAMSRAALEHRSRRQGVAAAWLALPVLALAALLLGVSSRSLPLAFAGLFCVLLAGAMATPLWTTVLMRVLEKPAERLFALPGLLAVRGVTASLSRTGVATAALAVAVATVIGVGLMITSFRTSLEAWLETTLTADLYVSLDESAGVQMTDARLVMLRGAPGVAGISLSRTASVPASDGELSIRAATAGPRGLGLDVVHGDPSELEALAVTGIPRTPEGTPADASDESAGTAEDALDESAGASADASDESAGASGDASADQGRWPIAVSEPFAFRRGLDVGDTLELPAARGPAGFRIDAIYREYNVGGSAIVMPLGVYRGLWDDRSLSSVGIHAQSRSEIEPLRDRVAEVLPAGARITSTARVVDASLAIFDQTFRITEVLRLLAALVAFFGVASALLAIELEKAREHAVLHAVGFGPRELGTLMLAQTALLGAAAGTAALPLGAALAGLLIHVINRRSFGWTMEFVLAPGPLASGLALALIAALLAGLYPAWRLQRRGPAAVAPHEE